MSADTAETVKKSRELMDSGVDPMALMSQLAGLIMDIIAGTYRLANSRTSGTALGGRRCKLHFFLFLYIVQKIRVFLYLEISTGPNMNGLLH
jgi:hypothetical protein